MSQGFRLSPQQRHLWRHEHADATEARCLLALEGPLDRLALRAALERIVARHEILRTSFWRQPGMKTPLQVIAEEGTPGWREIALAEAAEEERRRRIEAVAAGCAPPAFDLERGPVLDAALLALAPERHLLALRLPALCADLRSLGNLVGELGRELRGEGDGEEPVQFLQFSEWQNELLEDPEEEAGREHWRERLGGMPAPPALPFEAAPGEGLAGAWRPATVAVPLDPGAAAAARAIAGAAETGPAAFFLACWQALIHRLTGAREMVIERVYDGRKFEELEEALGLLARAVPLRLRCEGHFELRQLVARTGHADAEASEWQEYYDPESLLPGEGGEPAAAFAFEHGPAPPALDLGALRLTPCSTAADADRYKVKLSCLEGPQGVELRLAYDRRLLGAEAAACLALQLGALVASAASEPRTAVHDLELSSSEEHERLVVAFNETGAAPAIDGEGLVHRRFEAQARRHPGRPAVVAGEAGMTYDLLNRAANRLAHLLRASGVGPEVPVGFFLDRSERMLVALFGILKAGGAYLPLDVTLPAPRLAAMLEATAAPVVITERAVAAALPPFAGRTVVLDGDDAEALAGAPEENPEASAGPGNLVYLLFTSGSTGVPKAVAVEHRQLASYLEAVNERLQLPEGSSWALVSTFAADLGNTAIFPALCGGGCLHLVSQERMLDPEAFGGYFERHGIEALKIVPSHLATLLTGPRPERVLPARLLVLGGEASPPRLLARVRELAPGCRVLNHYGPTETTVGVTTHRVDDADSLSGGRVPLGRPLAGRRVYCLDRRLRPVVPGIPGELQLGGDGLARGYFGRPAATAEAFVPDFLSGGAGERLYRARDLARFRPGGELEFLGRADHQVKVRGFRVELGEIEAALRSCPAVRDAAAVAREEAGGRLVAFVVAAAERPPSSSELRRFLAERLPEPMVPAAIHWLEALPVTANGKLDRHALAGLDEASAEAGDGTAPRTLGESMIAELWLEVLGNQRVGVHDNFFELGGDSLQGIQLISRIRKVFDVELPVRLLFARPTVAGLAAAIDQARGGNGRPPLAPVPRDGDLPLAFAQQRLWSIHRLDPESAAYNTNNPVRLEGPIDLRALAAALSEVVRRHEVLRTTFPDRDGRPLQLIHPPAPLELPRIDLDRLDPERRQREARRLTTECSGRPFDLTAGPLLRMILLRLQPEDHVLVVTLHHAISDGWSTGVLTRELLALYQAFHEGRPSPLSELPVQYADYAHWQRRWLAGAALEEQLSYWREALAGAPELLALPTDFPRPERASFRGDYREQRLPEELTRRLRRLGRREGVTLFMTLLAAFQTLLGRYSGQDDLLVGTDVANRTHLELEGLIGFFINNLVLRADLSGNPTVAELLQQVRRTTLGALAHQDLPFDLLVRELQPRRTLSHTPLFQVLFVLQNMPAPEVELPGFSARLAEIDFQLTKFDLAVFVTETEEGLNVTWTYRSDLFRPETIERMAEHYGHLLRGFADQPEELLSRIEMRSPEEVEREERQRSRRRQAKIGKLRRSL